MASAASSGGRIQPDVVRGFRFAPVVRQLSEKDAILYALAVGAAAEDAVSPQDLPFVFGVSGGAVGGARGSRVAALPTFGVVLPPPILEELPRVPGLVFDMGKLLHGEQELELFGADGGGAGDSRLDSGLPVPGRVRTEARVVDVVDKGKAALLIVEALTFDDASGRLLCRNRTSIFLRGAGGFGGAAAVAGSGPSSAAAQPRRASVQPAPTPPQTTAAAPAAAAEVHRVVELRTSPAQALLYRLCGDMNPLHADPAAAAAAGFARPILHGLCTFGFAGRAITLALDPRGEGTLRALRGRFLSHVFPGETLRTEVWAAPPTAAEEQTRAQRRERLVRVRYQVTVTERGALVLAGTATFALPPASWPPAAAVVARL